MQHQKATYISKNGLVSFIILFPLISILYGCSRTEHNIEERKLEGYLVRAHFLPNGSVADGVAEYFDSAHVLVSRTTFKNGLKNGISINYDKLGHITDSANFFYGKKYGFETILDSTEKISNRVYYFFGQALGPEITYSIEQKITTFVFSDFNHRALAYCIYDQSGTLESIQFFDFGSSVTEKQLGNTSFLNLFLYTPQIPRAFIRFSVGTRKDNKDFERFEIKNTNQLFLDTLLPRRSKSESLYLRCDVKAIEGSFSAKIIEDILLDSLGKTHFSIRNTN